ncbi:MAG: DUF2969 family protein [Liquorilactobacillus hordei]|mgnify:FL=1|uniref:DUF2969 domain-containing protein n=2 Tax=Liquorilactobacillus hordei TaxID=468911 RepID=A0A0R1MK58_9LACO|nr:DUF2969 family protein [Liquorilactobacillus hordei]AUJ29966.1 hypothetical protein BSQ49_07000 [Liquorilactobacillus hordei]KRL08359.1 hypothetical protein FC92_GL000151 [Liquorilactobacillus hordei DSM 19519]MBZ2404773.1 DUF2969 domain-containing protein [Liquorilactobacillus hordei]QYH52572.1 DUF2969 family protein [Liquorilactobacillus hordei DSM 19519]
MSRKEKNIEIKEEEKVVNGETEIVLTIGSVALGSVRVSTRGFVALLPNGETFKTSSHDEAINLLIRDYHLHHAN